jgi:Domain of unknown function (DUF4145)
MIVSRGRRVANAKMHTDFCPHCGNTAQQKVALCQAHSTVWYSVETGERTDDDGPDCETIVCVCQTCNKVLVYSGLSRAETGEWPDLQYPEPGRLHRTAPGPVRDIYLEAALVKAKAPRAFALLIRRGVEAICEDRGITSGSLAVRLKKLAERGEVPPLLAEMTDVMRTLGNVAAHGPLEGVTVPMTWALDDFFRALVEYVYVAPSKLAEFRERLSKAHRGKKRDH